jgi:hypothetical protein
MKCCLQTLLYNTNVKQYDVIARDELSSVNFNLAPIALVVNTDDRRNPGRHWVAVYVWKVHGKLYSDHYDSYGNPLSRYGINIPVPMHQYNKKSHQQYSSSVCGLHSLRFLYKRSRGTSLATYVSHCQTDPAKNDDLVKQFYYNIQNLKIKSSQIKSAQSCCTRLVNQF